MLVIHPDECIDCGVLLVFGATSAIGKLDNATPGNKPSLFNPSGGATLAGAARS
jgi:hypothetical protein